MLPLDFHPLVEADLAASAGWYERQLPGLSERFLADAADAFQRLSHELLLHSVRFADVRRINLRTFRHGVFYVVTSDATVVLAVLHGARDSEAVLTLRRSTFGRG